MNDRDTYPKKWQIRFAFFDKYGAPSTPEFQAAFKTEKPMRRVLLNMNFTAFLFGLIYFFVLGLWRKNLVLLAIFVGIIIILFIIEVIFEFSFSEIILRAIAMGFAMMWGITANYSYYLKEVKGINGWNPFEGMRLR